MTLTDAGRDLQPEGSRIAGEVACKTRLADDEVARLREAIQQLVAAMHDDSPLPSQDPASNGAVTTS